jgi:hypothetical protein
LRRSGTAQHLDVRRYKWISTRTEQQEEQFQDWLHDVGTAGLSSSNAVRAKRFPTVRRAGESLQSHMRAQLVRINKREADGPAGPSLSAQHAGDDVRKMIGAMTTPAL